jgi:thymidine kinase
MRAVTAASGADVARLAAGYDAVGIDEVQFFDDGIVGSISALVARGARVVAAGLAQDFRGEPFGSMPTLLCIAEFVDKLEAVCHRCGGPATLTQRLLDGRPAPFGGETVQIGALDSYEARCRDCHSLSQPGWREGVTFEEWPRAVSTARSA